MISTHETATEPGNGSSLLDLLVQFSKLQSQRVEAYKTFEDAFSHYLLEVSNEEEYLYAVRETTKTFSGISAEIRRVETELHERWKRDDLAGMIRRVQESERTKLELTARFQVFAKESVGGVKDCDEEVAAVKSALIQTVEEINEVLTEIRCEMASI